MVDGGAVSNRMVSENSEMGNVDDDRGNQKDAGRKYEGQGLVLEYCGEKGAN